MKNRTKSAPIVALGLALSLAGILMSAIGLSTAAPGLIVLGLLFAIPGFAALVFGAYTLCTSIDFLVAVASGAEEPSES